MICVPCPSPSGAAGDVHEADSLGRSLAADFLARGAARLAAAGIRHIEDTGHCTYCDPARFFSYRRSTHRKESDYGRHISAIALAR